MTGKNPVEKIINTKRLRLLLANLGDAVKRLALYFSMNLEQNTLDKRNPFSVKGC